MSPLEERSYWQKRKNGTIRTRKSSENRSRLAKRETSPCENMSCTNDRSANFSLILSDENDAWWKSETYEYTSRKSTWNQSRASRISRYNPLWDFLEERSSSLQSSTTRKARNRNLFIAEPNDRNRPYSRSMPPSSTTFLLSYCEQDGGSATSSPGDHTYNVTHNRYARLMDSTISQGKERGKRKANRGISAEDTQKALSSVFLNIGSWLKNKIQMSMMLLKVPNEECSEEARRHEW